FGERCTVIPACGSRFARLAGTLEKNTQRICSATKRGSNSGCQTVACRRTNHQYSFGAVRVLTLLFDISDLFFDIGFAACRMRGHTNESAYTGLDDHVLLKYGK